MSLLRPQNDLLKSCKKTYNECIAEITMIFKKKWGDKSFLNYILDFLSHKPENKILIFVGSNLSTRVMSFSKKKKTGFSWVRHGGTWLYYLTTGHKTLISQKLIVCPLVKSSFNLAIIHTPTFWIWLLKFLGSYYDVN